MNTTLSTRVHKAVSRLIISTMIGVRNSLCGKLFLLHFPIRRITPTNILLRLSRLVRSCPNFHGLFAVPQGCRWGNWSAGYDCGRSVAGEPEACRLDTSDVVWIPVARALPCCCTCMAADQVLVTRGASGTCTVGSRACGSAEGSCQMSFG